MSHIEEVDVTPANPNFHLSLARDVDNPWPEVSPTHRILRGRLKRTGSWAFDPCAAQFGHTAHVVPWEAYKHSRVRHVSRRAPFVSAPARPPATGAAPPLDRTTALLLNLFRTRMPKWTAGCGGDLRSVLHGSDTVFWNRAQALMLTILGDVEAALDTVQRDYATSQAPHVPRPGLGISPLAIDSVPAMAGSAALMDTDETQHPSAHDLPTSVAMTLDMNFEGSPLQGYHALHIGHAEEIWFARSAIFNTTVGSPAFLARVVNGKPPPM